MRHIEFNNYIGENVVLKIEIPETNALLPDETNWHYVLSDWYLHDLNSEEGKWEGVETWFDGLPLAEKESVKRKSWEKIR